MALRDLLILAAISTLVFSGLYHGWRFLRLGNVLLGVEWLILGTSAANMFLLYAARWTATFWVMTFFDSFSRSIGVPVIGALGIAQVLGIYEPSKAMKTSLFVGGFGLALILITSAPLQPILPMLYIAIGLVFVMALLVLAARLLSVREYYHAFAVIFASVLTTVIALLEGVIAIPGDERNLVLNFYFIAHIGWAWSFAEMYYACAAYIHRSRDSGTDAGLVNLRHAR